MFIVRRLLASFGCFIMLLNAADTVAAQQESSHSVADIRAAYERLDHSVADSLARAALEEFERYDANDLADIYTILGLIAYSSNETAAAQQYFLSALSIDPGLELDARFVSPKILSFFDELKADIVDAGQNGQEPTPTVRYLYVGDPRPAAALRSMMLPGWGQWYKGQRRKGTVLAGLWTVTAGGVVTAHLLRERAHDRYLRDPDRFDGFNTWHKVRNNVAIAAAGVWVFSYADALVTGRPESLGRRDLIVAPATMNGRLAVDVRFQF